MAKVKQYLSYEPTVLGIIETNRNWACPDQTIKPLQTTMNMMNQDHAKVTTAHYREQHTATNTYQLGGVAQITLKPLSNRIDSVSSDKLGWWSNKRYDLTEHGPSLFTPDIEHAKPQWTANRQYMGSASPRTDAPWHLWPRPTKTIFYWPNQRTAQTEERRTHVHHGAWYELLTWWWWHTQLPLQQWPHRPIQWLLPNPTSDILLQQEHNGHDPWIHQHSTMDCPCIHPGPTTWTGQPLHHWTWSELRWPNRPRRPQRDWPNRLSEQTPHVDRPESNHHLYLEQVLENLESQNICNCFLALIEQCNWTNWCSKADKRAFQLLCTQLYDIVKHAKSKCKWVGPKPWSTTLASIGQALQIARKEFYRLVWCGIPQEQAKDKESAIACAKQSMETAELMVTDVKQHASTLHETGLQLLAEQYAAEHNVSKEMALKQLLCKECLTQIYQILGYHISGKYYDPLKWLLIPDNPTDPDNTTWTALLEAEAIWEALLHQGHAHFSQALDTPFATGPIADRVGPFKQNEFSDQILQGTFDINLLTNSVEVCDIIKSMQYQDTATPRKWTALSTSTNSRNSSSQQRKAPPHPLMDCTTDIGRHCFKMMMLSSLSPAWSALPSSGACLPKHGKWQFNPS